MTETLAYGSLDEAETAYLMNVYDRVLDGWEFLGSGIHRSAYLSPMKVVYKVAHDGYSSRQAQFAEILAVRVLSIETAPEGFGVPKADLVEVIPGIPVIAMEYVQGEGEYLDADDIRKAEAFYRNTDIHAGNIIRRASDGILFMIDLGFFSESFDPEDENDASCSCCRRCAYCGDNGCNAACLLCENCQDRECRCCEVCDKVKGSWFNPCDCCIDCGEVPGNCCCDFCDVCGLHNDDCRQDECKPWLPA